MLKSEEVVLIVIDVQGKLAEVMDDPEKLFANINQLSGTARALHIPTLVTEQLPEKLGPTRDEIKEHLSTTPIITKSAFSCCGEPSFMTALEKTGKKNILLCGIESHICVTQTALDLLNKQDYNVYIVADAVSSRSNLNKSIALQRMSKYGAEIVVTEMVMFELMRDAKHPAFGEVRKFLS